MQLPSYEFKTNQDFLLFSFESISDQKTIKKVVQFAEFQHGIYNMFLGDVDENGNQSDLNISNNKDMEKVLTTVAKIMIEFFEFRPNSLIYFTGSDFVRTRLYRIAISNYGNEFQDLFVVYGILNRIPELFVPNKNYEAFLISWND